jgi:transposase-like protein
MVFEAVECPTCGGVDIHRHGQSATGKKRYICLSTTANTDQTRHKTTYQKGSKQMPQ